MSVQYLNPEGLIRNPAFSQAITVSGSHKIVYIGGQDAVDPTGKIVGKDDIEQQTRQVFHNLQTALAAAGASLEHVVKWNVYIKQGQSTQVAFGVFQEVWGKRPNPPTISLLYVVGLAHPDFLVEIDAVAVVPE